MVVQNKNSTEDIATYHAIYEQTTLVSLLCYLFAIVLQ
jgi:hypothetical protein